jgi:hypothetical protein
MLRLAKSICWLTMLGLGVQDVSAFSLLGPRGQATGTPDGYQQPIIGYQLGTDIGTPKNLGEEYRRNTPVVYYSIDRNYLDYFGSAGSNAIVQAFEMMNSLTNVSSYSGYLDEFPREAQEYNYRAQALQLQDIKSFTLSLLVEQMGLAEPERWIWALRDRVVGGTPGCPITMTYDLVQRNFDPVWSAPDQLQTSSYVNGTLYTYFIFEICTGPNPLADAVEFSVDPAANIFTSVATIPDFGGFYTSLSRDDVGGLRYLYRTNNMNIEDAGFDTFTFITNNTTLQLLFTSNLNLFASQALTNDAAALSALYPNLIITGTTPIFTNVVSTNQIAFFYNSPYAPAGSPATLATNTTYTTNVAIWFKHTFANVVTNSVFTNGTFTLLTTNVGPCLYGPAGSICTNVTTQDFNIPMLMGDFYIIPTNLCSFSILATQLVQVLTETNLLVTATNAPGVTNVNGQEFSESIITYFTNTVFVVNPVVCPTNSTALRQGIENIKFVRRDYDSLLERFIYPITNYYTLLAVTNNTVFPQSVARVIIEPDFLITAADIGETDPNNGVHPGAGVVRSIFFDATNVATAYRGLAGPGTIGRPPGLASIGTVITYDKKGPHFENQFTDFFFNGAITGETNQFLFFAWGSFDGTTNAPVVYPNGTSITNLENSVLIFVQPSAPFTNGAVQLPNGTAGFDYSTVFSGFTAIGGQVPYSWALAPESPALPPDLVLNPDGTISGVPGPSTAGLTFDFVIRMTDAASRFVDRAYAITINP